MTRDERATEAPPLAAVTAFVLRLPAGISEPDRLAVEEPLEIRIDGRAVAVTMRTPGHDEELAVSFCLSEGIAARGAHLPDDLAANTVEVDVDGPFDREAVQRNFYTSSSCGVCGKGALEAVVVSASPVESELRVPLSLVASLPERLRAEQAAVGAPSSLAVETAQDRGVTLCGFVRDGNANVYTEPWRLET
jgi:formate dehydrogenase assembly factor FdhD